jgi:hypothetical protein
MKSFIAAHSFKNSGLETISNFTSKFLFFNSSRIISLHISQVQTGTVDLFIKTLYEFMFSQRVFATALTNLKSALWFSSGGVQTAENIAFQNSIHFLASVEKISLPSL